MANPSEILRPRPETRAGLMERIAYELGRRGAILRAQSAKAFPGFAAAEG
jgi:hypothetical protein